MRCHYQFLRSLDLDIPESAINRFRHMSPSETAAWSPVDISSHSENSFQAWCPQVMAPSALASSGPISPVATSYNSKRRFSSAATNTKHVAQALISQALQTRINNINPDECEAGGEDAFFVADLGEVYRQHMRWKINLPRVEPFYGKNHYFPSYSAILTNLV